MHNVQSPRADDNAIEQEIVAKGLTAPRVTPADIEANIASGAEARPAKSHAWSCVAPSRKSLANRGGHDKTRCCAGLIAPVQLDGSVCCGFHRCEVQGVCGGHAISRSEKRSSVAIAGMQCGLHHSVSLALFSTASSVTA